MCRYEALNPKVFYLILLYDLTETIALDGTTEQSKENCDWKIEKQTRLGNDADNYITESGFVGSWESLENAKISCLKTPECTGITYDDGQYLLRTSREQISDLVKTRTVFKATS